MTEVILFFAGCNALIFVWSKMWRSTFLDDARDKLFDLRDEMREYFVQNEISLDNKIHKNLRNLLNGHIRFLESFTPFTLTMQLNFLKKNKRLAIRMAKEINASFSSENKPLNEFSETIREKAIDILMAYLIKTSVALMFLTGITICYLIVKTLSLHIKDKFIDSANKVSQLMVKDKKYIEEVSYYSFKKTSVNSSNYNQTKFQESILT